MEGGFCENFRIAYWKSYNEEYVKSLKQAIRDLNRDQVPWWTLRSKKLLDQLHYPVTTSADELATEILNLDQLVVEGFETKWLRNKAQSLGRTPDISFASLWLVEEYLSGFGFAEEDATRLVASLRETHDFRSKVKGHASVRARVQILILSENEAR